MFNCSISAIEFQMELFMDIIAERFDRNTNPKASFIHQGFLPNDFMADYSIGRIDQNQIIRLMQRKGYLKMKTKRQQVDNIRKSCYIITQKLFDYIKNK